MAQQINVKEIEEKELNAPNGLLIAILFIILYVGAAIGIIPAGMDLEGEAPTFGGPLLAVCVIWLLIGWIPFLGVKVIRPNEALVLTLFGKYTGTLKKDGIFFVNPFSSAINPTVSNQTEVLPRQNPDGTAVSAAAAQSSVSKKISLKAMTLNNKKQKINDRDGNPVEVSIVVIWKVTNTAKAVFCVDNYSEYISIQADSTLRDVASLYPYDSTNGEEKSLRGSCAEIADNLRTELQGRVENAGLEIIEARITHLAYAPEIAAAMLQRQQAAAIIEARQKIVDGAVGMVEMALERITENNVCDLDDERKAQMVSNLLVVLCGNKDAQPIVNSGSIY